MLYTYAEVDGSDRAVKFFGIIRVYMYSIAA